MKPAEPTLQILTATLENYFAAIAAQTSASPPALLPIMEKLDALERELGPSAAPMLQHFLSKKSYQKALFFLQGKLTEHTT